MNTDRNPLELFGKERERAVIRGLIDFGPAGEIDAAVYLTEFEGAPAVLAARMATVRYEVVSAKIQVFTEPEKDMREFFDQWKAKGVYNPTSSVFVCKQKNILRANRVSYAHIQLALLCRSLADFLLSLGEQRENDACKTLGVRVQGVVSDQVRRQLDLLGIEQLF